jgi:hypothetical protein
VQNELFPHQSLQERNQNFSPFYEAAGANLIASLLKNTDPLKFEFAVIEFI